MPRQLRKLFPGAKYHVMNRGNGRQLPQASLAPTQMGRLPSLHVQGVACVFPLAAACQGALGYKILQIAGGRGC